LKTAALLPGFQEIEGVHNSQMCREGSRRLGEKLFGESTENGAKRLVKQLYPSTSNDSMAK
jgi:hypothetical protein